MTLYLYLIFIYPKIKDQLNEKTPIHKEIKN